ncbi:hypothetical protein [Nannocystis punicea]|uniref:Uncharacterized protein n=1 Tax=Nannocystis punicea TaxID=2995304 RepID=A0ABY7HFU3_9BACT|nr:hypothetical protein [Nannocystis poenicansa]WAS98071.1 hypothetical protein O0S08_18180 [Nannocystis poenicansa]
MPTLDIARIALVCAVLACGPNSGETTAETTQADSTGASASTTTTAASEPDPVTGTTTDATTGDITTTALPTGSLTTSTATTEHEATSTTTDPGQVCGEGWCAAKDFINVVIKDNHEDAPHELVIPTSDVKACELRTYGIQGAADHDHTITLTPELFLAIDDGGQFDLESTEAQGHTHMVWGDCE